MAPIEPLSTSILATMYAGDVVLAVSGALNAARHRMDVLGFVLIGTITGIGGSTMRDLLLGRTVWWTHDTFELLLCGGFVVELFLKTDMLHRKWMIWSDAIGLACFAAVGSHVALSFGAAFPVAVFLGMVTATGRGGLTRYDDSD